MKKEGEINLKILSIILGLFIIGCAPSNLEEQNSAKSRGLNKEELEELQKQTKISLLFMKEWMILIKLKLFWVI